MGSSKVSLQRKKKRGREVTGRAPSLRGGIENEEPAEESSQRDKEKIRKGWSSRN